MLFLFCLGVLLGCFFCGGDRGDMKMVDDEEKGEGVKKMRLLKKLSMNLIFND